MKSALLSDIEQKHLWNTLHEQACAKGEYYYRDPISGYIVFTEIKHLHRGYCCKSGCRHCPFGYSKSKN